MQNHQFQNCLLTLPFPANRLKFSLSVHPCALRMIAPLWYTPGYPREMDVISWGQLFSLSAEMLHQAEPITGKERNKNHPCLFGSFIAGASSRVRTLTDAAQSHGLCPTLCTWWSESTAVKSSEITGAEINRNNP